MVDISAISGIRASDAALLDAHQDLTGESEKFSSSLAAADDAWVNVLALAEKLHGGNATPDQIAALTRELKVNFTQFQDYMKEIEQRFT